MKSSSFKGLFVMVALVVGGGALGCEAADMVEGQSDDPAAEVAAVEQALARGTGGPRAGYTCSGTTCECDKSIENDCEDMSAVCTDATVDALIACINGWLTTHCTCTKAMVAPPKTVRPYAAPTGGVLMMTTAR